MPSLILTRSDLSARKNARFLIRVAIMLIAVLYCDKHKGLCLMNGCKAHAQGSWKLLKSTGTEMI